MGTCDYCRGIEPLRNNICQIKSEQGVGIGFFCRISLPKEKEKLKFLITSNTILNNEDFYTGNNIELYFKKRNKYINLKIDEDRKCYPINEYQLSLIEIKEKDDLKFLSFLNLESSNTNLDDAYLLYIGNNNEDKKYNLDKINYENNNDFIFNFSINSENSNSYNFIGSPILILNKVIGILIEKKEYNNYIGILLSQAIKNHFSSKNYIIGKTTNINSSVTNNEKQIIVTFHDKNYNKDYEISAESNFMFGELIIYFFLESGLEFDEKMNFYFNGKKISSYSTDFLINLNIENKSKIAFERKELQMKFQCINLIFNFNNTRLPILAYLSMSVKELIIKFCQIFRYPFYETVQNNIFLYNSKKINDLDGNLEYFGFRDSERIDVIEKGM